MVSFFFFGVGIEYQDCVKDLKDWTCNSELNKTLGSPNSVELSTILLDNGLIFENEDSEMCKLDVGNLKFKNLTANPNESSGLKDPT